MVFRTQEAGVFRASLFCSYFNHHHSCIGGGVVDARAVGNTDVDIPCLNCRHSGLLRLTLSMLALKWWRVHVDVMMIECASAARTSCVVGVKGRQREGKELVRSSQLFPELVLEQGILAEL